MELHPETAKKHGVEEGDWVWIESPRGCVRQRARLNEGLNPPGVVAEQGWRYPEIKTPDHGWDISNINILTDNSPEFTDPVMRATTLRVLLCNIARCEDQIGVGEMDKIGLLFNELDCSGCHACEVACKQKAEAM